MMCRGGHIEKTRKVEGMLFQTGGVFHIFVFLPTRVNTIGSVTKYLLSYVVPWMEEVN